MIRVEFGRDARDRLAGAGLDVTYREDPVGHAIAPAALAQARDVLEARARAAVADEAGRPGGPSSGRFAL